MSLFLLKFNFFYLLISILLQGVVFQPCNSLKEVVNLDIKSNSLNEDIKKISKFRKWTTFKVIDPANKRIGEVKYGEIVIMKDTKDDISERIVYFKVLRRILEKYIIKVVTIINDVPRTDEFIIIDTEFDKKCIKIVREPIDVNIGRIDKTVLKVNNTIEGWTEYAIRNEITTQYRMGSIFEGNTVIVSDSSNTNIRLRYLHVSRHVGYGNIMHLCIPFLKNSYPKIVRVFTYYNEGERSFDEYVQTLRNGVKVYTELVRRSASLDLSSKNRKYIKKTRTESDNYLYLISDKYKNWWKIGKVTNKSLLIIDDDESVRLRSVYTHIDDLIYEFVEVKTCYKRGDCKKCKYVLEDNKYRESTCKLDMDDLKESASSGNVFSSDDKLSNTNNQDKYMKGIVSFDKGKTSTNDIVVDVMNPTSNHFTIDMLPSSNGLFFSLNKELMGKDNYLRITKGDKSLVNVHLYKTSEVEFIVKMGENEEPRVLMWVKCGMELFKDNEVIVIDSLRNRAMYMSNKIDSKVKEFIDNIIN
ncbi:hypothetical protein TpMuguga_03g00856 [Theileria parva strain Muguga]|uniref:Uncharacterized protein n=1 Tax=Theileria parva TaxID=5875 RepID=Q4MYI5_THEPA|nr:uncharacterized protein TpMuguga_03g00856 [Theileria parva strain Muguga]EAN30697.1 hypothetical protein TpMuguga_03g00856 [Theileria parva strain Muguga]|eukprot:XP_762980.1 hypothetical protein [Theileria parva strain Muguga]